MDHFGVIVKVVIDEDLTSALALGIGEFREYPDPVPLETRLRDVE